MSNATDQGSAATANVAAGEGQEQAGQPVADGAGAEGSTTEGEGKPADGAAPTALEGAEGEGGEAAAAEGESEGAPEDYGDFELPEGFTLEEADKTALVEFGKQHNLSKEAAQNALNLATAHVQKVVSQFEQAQQARIEEWATQAKADPLVGGPKYAENVSVALAAVEKFGDKELSAAFNEYGLGNHPAFVRAFYRIGQAMRESPKPHGLGQEEPAVPQNREQALAQRIAQEQARQKA